MEQQISQVIPKIAETLELTNYSNKLSETLTETLTNEEKNILTVKYKSKQFGNMDAIEVLNECMLLVLRISIITGWLVPPAEMKNILIEQLCKKMVESYPNVNVAEVEYAFRNRDTGVKDWGKNFNLTLFDEVMIPYVEKRFEISDVEEKIKTVPEQKLYTDEEILNQRRKEIEETFQYMKKGYYPLIHIYFKEVLLGDELIGEEETIGEFFVRKLNSQTENIYIEEI